MTARCRSCGALIVWAKSAKTGKPMPLDHDRVTSGVRFQADAQGIARLRAGVEPGHASHFATCPDAARHRRKP